MTSNGEDYTIGLSAHEVTPMLSEEHIRYPQALDIPLLVSLGIIFSGGQIFHFEGGLTTPSEGAQSLPFTDASLKGWGAH